jgi:hypothetical protein
LNAVGIDEWKSGGGAESQGTEKESEDGWMNAVRSYGTPAEIQIIVYLDMSERHAVCTLR